MKKLWTWIQEYIKKYIFINILIIGCYDEYYDVMMVFYFSTLNYFMLYIKYQGLTFSLVIIWRLSQHFYTHHTTVDTVDQEIKLSTTHLVMKWLGR